MADDWSGNRPQGCWSHPYPYPYDLEQQQRDIAEIKAILTRSDTAVEERLRTLEIFYNRRQTLDFVIVMLLVIVGDLWTKVITSFIEDVLFPSKRIGWLRWLVVALIGAIVFLVVVRILRTPVFFFA